MYKNNIDGCLQLDPVQHKLYKALESKAPELARMYLSALQVLSQAANADRFYLTAHAIRKMMNKLPQCINVPIENVPRQRLGDLVHKLEQNWTKMLEKKRWPGDPRWTGDIDADLRSFLSMFQNMLEENIKIQESQSKSFQSVLRKHNFSEVPLPNDIEEMRVKDWNDFRDYFIKIAHYHDTDEDIFLGQLEKFQRFLLDCLMPRTFEIHNELKEIIDQGESDLKSKEDRKKLIESAFNKIQRSADYDYFFVNLKSPDWLEPLDELKKFDAPHDLINEEGTISFPFWQPACYLTKISAEKPEQVMKVIKRIKNVSNPRLYEEFAKATLNMPPAVAVEIYKKVRKQWMNCPYFDIFLLSYTISNYITHINSGGFTEQALGLTDALLAFKSRSNQSAKNKDSFIQKAEPIVENTCKYNEILKQISPSFLKNDKVQLIKILCGRLYDAISIEIEDINEEKFQDYSFIWRNAVEDFDPKRKADDVKDILINWIRNLSENLLIEFPEIIESVIDYFRQEQLPIFSRFALHLVRLNKKPSLISKYILDKKLCNAQDVWHEYALLLEAGYPLLDENQQESFLCMIASNNSSIQDQNAIEANERRLYRYYFMIRNHLFGKEKEIFERLYAKFEEIKHPTFFCYQHPVIIGPISPKSSEALSSMSIPDLKKFLEDFSPENQGFDSGVPSSEGLGRALSSIVSERLEEFMNNIDLFKLREKTYVRAIIEGFSKAATAKKAIVWHKIVGFLEWVSSQSDDPHNAIVALEDDKDLTWGWSRKAACSLIQQGFSSNTNPLPLSYRAKVWKIIAYGLSDIDPKLEDEDRYISSTGYYHTAINSVRGVALETALYYGIWVKENLNFPEGNLPIEKCTELFDALDRHLNVKTEQSKAIRAVYGCHVPTLYSLNKAWFEEKKKEIFPQGNIPYWTAAWEAYCLHSGGLSRGFIELHDHYLLAIDRIQQNEGKQADTLVEQVLVKHIIGLYMSGELHLTSPLIIKFYDKINVPLRKIAVTTVGVILTHQKEGPKECVVKRAKDFWDFRINDCKNSKDSTDKMELVEFGYWMEPDQLGGEWVLDQIIAVLDLCKRITPDYRVMECLSELVELHPIKVAKVLQSFVDYWRLECHSTCLSVMEALFPILLKSPARDEAIIIIHKLGARGFNQFADLLKI